MSHRRQILQIVFSALLVASVVFLAGPAAAEEARPQKRVATKRAAPNDAADVHFDPVRVKGPLSQADASGALRRHRKAFAGCWPSKNGIPRGPNVDVRILVRPNGKVSGVTIE